MQLLKRAAFNGMRGKKAVFNGMRGKKDGVHEMMYTLQIALFTVWSAFAFQFEGVPGNILLDIQKIRNDKNANAEWVSCKLKPHCSYDTKIKCTT